MGPDLPPLWPKIGPNWTKIGPNWTPPGPPPLFFFFFACRPKMDPPPPFKYPASAPGTYVPVCTYVCMYHMYMGISIMFRTKTFISNNSRPLYSNGRPLTGLPQHTTTVSCYFIRLWIQEDDLTTEMCSLVRAAIVGVHLMRQ